MGSQQRINYLEEKMKNAGILESAYDARFKKEARYMGNGVYSWVGQFASNPRELKLLGILIDNDVKFTAV